jgi:HupE / UreJ protein
MSGVYVVMRSLCLFAALVFGSQAHSHQASDAFATVRINADNTHAMTLAVALKDLDLALPEADADSNRELTWRELQAVMPLAQQWLGQHVMLACQQAGVAPTLNPSIWTFEALEDRSSGVYVRMRTARPCAIGTHVSLRYTLMQALDATHRLIINTDLQGKVQAVVWAPSDAPLMLRTVLSPLAANSAPSSNWSTLVNFVPEGVHHILTGYDHLAFLLALLLPLSLRSKPPMPNSGVPNARQMGLRELLWTVTAFTCGHSVTLVLASLGLSAVPVWVEPAIAISIGLSAWLNLYPQQLLSPPWLALGFGLIHGLGFANVMREANLSAAPLAWALAGFNAGVELGQLACVGVWCAINLAVARWKHYDRVVTRGGSMALMALATYWTWERVA